MGMNNTNTNAAQTIETLNALTAKYTAFNTLQELCETPNYVPSIRCLTGFGTGKRKARTAAELTALADRYDLAQFGRMDGRRAWRC
jgi:hypothetical protein